jgi:hypothetical protein
MASAAPEYGKLWVIRFVKTTFFYRQNNIVLKSGNANFELWEREGFISHTKIIMRLWLNMSCKKFQFGVCIDNKEITVYKDDKGNWWENGVGNTELAAIFGAAIEQAKGITTPGP